MEPKEIKHRCAVCKKSHSALDYQWHRFSLKTGSVQFYCNKGIDCTGCQKVHLNTTGRAKTLVRDGKLINLCGIWFRNHVSMEKKMEGLSPQEVLSGVQYGLPEQKGVFSDEANRQEWSKDHAEGVQQLREELA